MLSPKNCSASNTFIKWIWPELHIYLKRKKSEPVACHYLCAPGLFNKTQQPAGLLSWINSFCRWKLSNLLRFQNCAFWTDLPQRCSRIRFGLLGMILSSCHSESRNSTALQWWTLLRLKILWHLAISPVEFRCLFIPLKLKGNGSLLQQQLQLCFRATTPASAKLI